MLEFGFQIKKLNKTKPLILKETFFPKIKVPSVYKVKFYCLVKETGCYLSYFPINAFKIKSKLTDE